MWPYKDRYMPGVIRDEFNYYTGTVVYEKWYKPNRSWVDYRTRLVSCKSRSRDRIVEVNELPVDYTEPASDRIEKIIIGSKGNEYTVVKEYGKSTCTCPGFTFRGQCKHLLELVNG